MFAQSRSNLVALCLFMLATATLAQDPAQGWMGYAVGVHPSKTQIGIKSLSYTMVVPDLPANGNNDAFYSPWGSVESHDNLNLIQTVNPWLGNGWNAYNEYFQWSPVHNHNSESISVSPGDVMHCQIWLEQGNNSYSMLNTDTTTGQSVFSSIPIQNDENGQPKVFDHSFFVMEKVWRCDNYPKNGNVVFNDIDIEFLDGEKKVVWGTAVVDDNCNCRAHIVNSSTIKITWDIQSEHPLDQTVLHM